MRKITHILLLAILLLMAGCASGNATPPAGNDVQEPITDPVDQQPPLDNAPDDSEQQPSDDPDDNDQDGQQEPEEVVVEKKYYMNNIFDIKPIDEETDANIVLLTFDDGPQKKENIEKLLAALEKHNAKAIFFENGDMVELHPDLLKLTYDAGMTIGNHSYNHIPLGKETDESIKEQVDRATQIIEETIGEAPKFFRPPNASSNDFLRQHVKDQGMLYMTWSNGSLDWDLELGNTPEKLIKNIFDQLRPGSNILMHERDWTAEALDDLLTQLEDAGYSFVDPESIMLEPLEQTE